MIATLDGRGAVVTGAAAGIGLAVAERLRAEGMRVVLADIDAAQLATAVDRLGGEGAGAHGRVVDVRDAESVERLAAEAWDAIGPVHLLVNNAGVVAMGRVWELPLEDWRRVVDVDLWGVLHGVRAFVPRMLAGGHEGHVVNIGSMQSVTTLPHLGAYAVAKHGVLGLTDALRAELAAAGGAVGASIVLPGRILTTMNAEGAPASVVADAVVAAATRDLPYVATDPDRVGEVTSRFAAVAEGFGTLAGGAH